MRENPKDEQGGKRSPGRPKRAGQEGRLDTENLILYHAGLLFMKSGYAAVSINMITKAAGITKPTLYHYFPDKEHLYASVLHYTLEKVGEEIRATIGDARSVREKLYDLAYGFYKYAAMSLHTLLRDVTEQLSQELAEQVCQTFEEQIVKPHRALFEEAMRRGEFRSEPEKIPIYTDIWLGLLDALVIRAFEENTDEKIVTIAQSVVSVFMDGVGNKS